MEKVNQRIRLTKRLLKESFVELLQQKDIHKISIRELCENAGINHCTFYKYYGSQYDLLKEMEDDILNKLEQTIAEVSDKDPIMILLEYLEENINMAKLLINNNIDPMFPEKLFSLPIVQEKFAKMLSKNYGENYFNYITSSIFYGAFRICQIWLNKEEREPPKEMAQLLLKVLEQLNDF